jgi:hypothetical protein
MRPVRGSFWVLVLYDVTEQIQLDQLCNLIGVGPVQPQPGFFLESVPWPREDTGRD